MRDELMMVDHCLLQNRSSVAGHRLDLLTAMGLQVPSVPDQTARVSENRRVPCRRS